MLSSFYVEPTFAKLINLILHAWAANGAGKSTLLNLIMDRLKPNKGSISRNGNLRIGHFTQHSADKFNLHLSAVENMLNLFSGSEVRALILFICMSFNGNEYYLSRRNRALSIVINVSISSGSNYEIVLGEVSDPGDRRAEADDDAIRRAEESCCICVACLPEASRHNYGRTDESSRHGEVSTPNYYSR